MQVNDEQNTKSASLYIQYYPIGFLLQSKFGNFTGKQNSCDLPSLVFSSLTSNFGEVDEEFPHTLYIYFILLTQCKVIFYVKYVKKYIILPLLSKQSNKVDQSTFFHFIITRSSHVKNSLCKIV